MSELDQEPGPWRANHGTAILLFAGAICLIGSLILIWRQSRRADNVASITNSQTASIASSENAIVTEQTAEQYRERGVRPIQLRIFGASSDVGVMRIALYTDAASFNQPEQAADLDRWQIRGGLCGGIWELPLEITECAFAVYHDENENGELDLNPVGFPLERYGFSNDARGLLGPPSYDEAKIVPDDQPLEISIR